MNERSALATLRDIREWLTSALEHGPVETRGHVENCGHPKLYTAVLIPDWQVKQKLANIADSLAFEAVENLAITKEPQIVAAIIGADRPDEPDYEYEYGCEIGTGYATRAFKEASVANDLESCLSPEMRQQLQEMRPLIAQRLREIEAEGEWLSCARCLNPVHPGTACGLCGKVVDSGATARVDASEGGK